MVSVVFGQSDCPLTLGASWKLLVETAVVLLLVEILHAADSYAFIFVFGSEFD